MPHHDSLDHSTTLTGFAQARYAGVDTHTDTHHAAIVDGMGRRLADAEFVTTSAGYQALLDWLSPTAGQPESASRAPAPTVPA